MSDQAVQECYRQIETDYVKLRGQFQDCMDLTKPLLWQLLSLYDLVGMMYGAEESAYITSHQITSQADRMLWDKAWFAESIPMGFENVLLPVPVGWDPILRMNYGDYMCFPSCKENHGECFEQMQILMQRGFWKPEEEPLVMSYSRPGIFLLPKHVEVIEDLKKKYKMVLYATSLTGMLRGGERYLQKIRNTIRTFEEQKEVILWWYPHDIEGCQYRELDPELFEAYEHLIEEYQASGQGILDQTDNRERAVELCDAYYGDIGDMFELFEQTGKPMMRQNDDILS